MIDYVALMLINMAAGLAVLAGYIVNLMASRVLKAHSGVENVPISVPCEKRWFFYVRLLESRISRPAE